MVDVAVAKTVGLGIGGVVPNDGSSTQISDCQDPLETELRRAKYILSMYINPSPISQHSKVDLYI